jgi:hypothetical protein
MKKFVLVSCAFAALALPVAANAASYNATIGVTLNGYVQEGTGITQVHTFDVVADCDNGHYTGTGSASWKNAGVERVEGDIFAGGFNGKSVYGDTAGLPGYTWSFNLASTDLGTTYAGTGSDSWETFSTLTGTLSVGNKVTACSTRVAPAVVSKDQCKKDGWKSVSRANDSAFKNQGDCVSYVETGV